jgi:hypothetical protein
MNRKMTLVLMTLLFGLLVAPGLTLAGQGGPFTKVSVTCTGFRLSGGTPYSVGLGDTLGITIIDGQQQTVYSYSAIAFAPLSTGDWKDSFGKAPAAGTLSFVLTLANSEPTVLSATYPANCASPKLDTGFTDGRLDKFSRAQTAIIFCRPDNSLEVWGLEGSNGKPAFTVTLDELAKRPLKPKKNTLLKSGLNIRLYRLTSGELQVNAPELAPGKEYVHTFRLCRTTP